MSSRYDTINKALTDLVRSLESKGVYTLYRTEVEYTITLLYGTPEPGEVDYHAEEWGAT